MDAKKEIFERYLNDYLTSSRFEKKVILDTVCSVTKVHRKTAIRKFTHLQLADRYSYAKRGRKLKYTPDVLNALKTIWSALGEICGELVHPVIGEMVLVLSKQGNWPHSKEVTKKLQCMSLSTAKRSIGNFFKARNHRRGISSTKPSHIKTLIPMFSGPWEDKPAGFGQIDTVAHCGDTMSGNMVFSVNYTDVATYWVVLSAQWNKGQEATKESLVRMRERTPFPVLGLHPDSGSEFVNFHLQEWCEKEKIEITRSRPNHKNDNAYVEQKNGHVIRRHLGYERFDVKETVVVINKMYNLLEIYLNHFIPTRKCIAKQRLGARYKRKYDTAATPFTRVLASPDISEEYKDKLKKEHKNLDPLILKTKIDKLIDKIMRIQQLGTKTRAN